MTPDHEQVAEERVEERWYVCRACRRSDKTADGLLGQGCQGNQEPFVPESRALHAEQEAERLKAAVREIDWQWATVNFEGVLITRTSWARLWDALSHNPEERRSD